MVKFYIRQTEVSRHAACACIAELGAKVRGGSRDKGQRRAGGYEYISSM